MQTIRRQNATPLVDRQWPATQATGCDTASGCYCMRRINEVERQLLDALATLREVLTNCEPSLDQAAETCMRGAIGQTQPYATQPGCRSTAQVRPDRLTTREVEVLRLIAAGHSNRRIADALFISPRTIERHIANIYLKIDAHSKTEATAYAKRNRME